VHPIERLGIFQKHNQVKIAAVVYDDLNEVEEICNR
jgi:hypothetical protein